ncbi:LysR substrate-binding domain-containing protein [Pseudoalteromonas fenneropenaei]|uniref:LysR substrate-binding domain-containing protein n=1 Tax=Pseudoalteromonas fenneropenaei TaxID=1737459 RepID=A0ABV7CMV2_9GAMM
MDKLAAMAMLVKVIEQGSFSAASKAMDIPLATLSRKVAELEKQLGVSLLKRTTRALTLTHAGEGYLAAAKRILEQVAEAEQHALGEYQTPKGELVITAPVMFGRLHVLPVVSEFLAAYPDINIKLNLSDRNLHLLDEHIDMAVRIGALPDSSLYATAVGTIRTVTCASPQLLSQYVQPVSPADLPHLPCITIKSAMPTPHWQYQHPETQKTITPVITSRLEVTNGECALQAAIDGVGVTQQLHYQVYAALQSSALTLILPEYEPAPVPIHLVHGEKRIMPLKMRCFLDFAVPRIRESVGALSDAKI